ncbi:SurA N-terminal domain-containing protein [Blattabacterium cuenoti]|uniref:SurA N-terminal domain-containing protein n=1 Tax=Blattabacterium cuenoti TaxID=1653831 RepID=UPI00163C68F3|nr:SurA N-terminal domain-containing protein [Blattabacterium cuenoti]
MNFLEKIRKNTWILFFLIGIAMLAFILDPHVLFKFFSEKSSIIGKVNGENISIKEYVDCFQFLKQFRQEESDFHLKKETWNLLIHEKLLNQQAMKLGIQNTKKDFWDAISRQSIYSYIPELQDKFGNLDLKKFQLYLKNLENASHVSHSQMEIEKNIWSYEKNSISKRILTKKYVEMLMYGLNTSLIEGELNYKEKNFFSIIDYIFIPYSEIEHKYNMFLIGKNEIENFIKKHKFLYKRENLRSLSFAICRSKPSLEDEKNMKNKMEKLFHKFKSTNKNYMFVLTKSEKPFDSNFYLKNNLPPILQNFVVQNNKIGSMFSPIKEDNTYVMAKIIGKKMISDYVLSSHILISHKEAIHSSNKRTKKEAEEIANKIYKILQKDSSKFEELVRKKSDDLINAKKNQGSLGWLKYNEQNSIGKFNIFDSKNKKNMIGLTETQFGYHIIRIDDKSLPKPAYQFAVIVKTLIPSKKTEDRLYSRVRKFFGKNKNHKLNIFINNARKEGYETIFLKYVRSDQWDIDDLKTEVDKEIIDWSFDKNRKEGDCHIFYTSNKDYIIVYLSKIQKEGFSMEEIKNNLTPFLKREKINRLLSDMEKRKFFTRNLEEIASYFSKKIIKNCKINFYDSMVNDHKEPKVVGYASSLRLYKTSKPILGKKGVFFIRPSRHIFPSKKPSYFSHEIEMLNALLRKKILENIGNVLIKKSIIKDYRKNFQ